MRTRTRLAQNWQLRPLVKPMETKTHEATFALGAAAELQQSLEMLDCDGWPAVILLPVPVLT